MTKTQYRKMMRTLIKETTSTMRKKAEQVLWCGCVDLKNHPNNYLLPKAAMTAICQHLAGQWEPLSPTGKAESKNIQLFI